MGCPPALPGLVSGVLVSVTQPTSPRPPGRGVNCSTQQGLCKSNTRLASIAPDGSLTWGVVLGVGVANLGVAVMGVTILGVERLACWSSTLLTDLKPTPVGHVMYVGHVI